MSCAQYWRSYWKALFTDTAATDSIIFVCVFQPSSSVVHLEEYWYFIDICSYCMDPVPLIDRCIHIIPHSISLNTRSLHPSLLLLLYNKHTARSPHSIHIHTYICMRPYDKDKDKNNVHFLSSFQYYQSFLNNHHMCHNDSCCGSHSGGCCICIPRQPQVIHNKIVNKDCTRNDDARIVDSWKTKDCAPTAAYPTCTGGY